jgi:hypothetical protein
VTVVVPVTLEASAASNHNEHPEILTGENGKGDDGGNVLNE